MGVAKHGQSTQSNRFAISLQYLKENVKDMKLIFCVQINIKSFFKLIPSLIPSYVWLGMPKLPKITTLQNLQKEVSDEVNFLHTD